MKTIFHITLVFFTLVVGNISAQTTIVVGEKYGKTLNAGVGIGYYTYMGNSSPVFKADLEFDVARNFTLAPFITYFSYSNSRYWGTPSNGYQDYVYRQTVLPVGLKGTYYFDQFLGAGSKWDFYLAASLGFAIRNTTWDSAYTGDRTIENGTSGPYYDGHIGTEYHLNTRVGLLLDISTGISTLSLAFHL